MNQVAGPLASAGFGFHNNASAAHQRSGVPQQTATQSPSSGQAFAPAAQAGYYDGGMPKNWNMTPFAGQQQSYTTAAFAPSVPAQASSGLVSQPLPRQGVIHNASPQQQRQSPDAASQAQQKPSTESPRHLYPMNPPLPHTPGSMQHALSNSSTASPGTPQSPGSQSREQQRIALLLDINAELLQEVSRLQQAGKGGASNVQQQALLRAQGQQMELAAEEYTQVLRRVQANLAYLMPRASNDQQKAPKGPAHMTPPPHMPQLQAKYYQLQEVFPDWEGYDRRTSASSASPQPNGMGAASGMSASSSVSALA